jgi:hypothetical protein
LGRQTLGPMSESRRFSPPCESEAELELAMNNWPFFNCPKCKAPYHVVKVPTGLKSVGGEVTCRLCSEPLPGREAAYVLKYFPLHKISPEQKRRLA